MILGVITDEFTGVKFYPHYYSTYCIHGLHEQCRHTCKHCEEHCRCMCHLDAHNDGTGA